MALGNVARLDPFAGQAVTVVEGEKFEAWHAKTMQQLARSVQRLPPMAA